MAGHVLDKSALIVTRAENCGLAAISNTPGKSEA